ncbi:hypothetical protein PSP20601_04908 [Pandoraea sputorum]|nr:hypothetical protein PSP20601_04908 [Pandoraea sputorum]
MALRLIGVVHGHRFNWYGTMEREISMRLRWVHMCFETGTAGLVCTRCGSSRPTLLKWLRRYQEAGDDGLRAQSRRPLSRPNRKVSDADRATMLRLQCRDGHSA